MGELKPNIWLISLEVHKLHYPLTTTYKIYPSKLSKEMKQLLCKEGQTVGKILLSTKEDFFESLMNRYGGELVPGYSVTSITYYYNIERHLVFLS